MRNAAETYSLMKTLALAATYTLTLHYRRKGHRITTRTPITIR